MTLGTLSSDKLRNLEGLGVLPREATAEYSVHEPNDNDDKIDAAISADSAVLVERNQGLPWFDTMVEGSRLGNMKKSMGVQRSRHGNVRVEWEIVEWTADDEGSGTPNSTKRKLDDVFGDGNDSKMEGLH